MAIKKPTTKAKRAARGANREAAAAPLSTIYLISDSTGNLAQHMLTAFMTQFPAKAIGVRRFNFVATADRLAEVMDEIARRPGMVMHALVSPDMKAAVAAGAKQFGVPACDLTGDFVDFISQHSGVQPAANVKRLHDTNDAYHQRIAALEFTLEHDDGLGLETLHEADIVLAGVSRTSKTPTSIYLAQQGYKVANVSLAIQVAPPVQLLGLKRTVIGLVIDPDRLREIRSSRQAAWRMADTSYNEYDAVKAEVAWSRQLFAQKGWPTLDVTNSAVEETAARVVEVLKLGRGAEA
jgi:hypothetical protein